LNLNSSLPLLPELALDQVLDKGRANFIGCLPFTEEFFSGNKGSIIFLDVNGSLFLPGNSFGDQKPAEISLDNLNLLNDFLIP